MLRSVLRILFIEGVKTSCPTKIDPNIQTVDGRKLARPHMPSALQIIGFSGTPAVPAHVLLSPAS